MKVTSLASCDEFHEKVQSPGENIDTSDMGDNYEPDNSHSNLSNKDSQRPLFPILTNGALP